MAESDVDAGYLVKQRRKFLCNYDPPSRKLDMLDPMTGEPRVVQLVPAVNVVFFGPVGSGKSSLIGSLSRAISDWSDFPDTVKRSLRQEPTGGTVKFSMPPGAEDEHGTLNFVETKANQKGTIVLQDTKGDETFDQTERIIHVRAMRAFYKDGAPLGTYGALSGEWWRERFVWQRTLEHMPHCVVFVFNGAEEKFFSGERRAFFIKIFSDCKEMGYEPLVVVTFLDQICHKCRQKGRNFEIVKQEVLDCIMSAFDRFHLPASHIYFVTNFHDNSSGRFWSEEDDPEAFMMANRQFIDLSMEMVKLCGRFIDRKDFSQRQCSIL